MLLTLAQRGAAQGVETNNSDLRLVGGTSATNPGDVAHSFVVLRPISGGYDYPRVMNITNAGRVGIGSYLSGGSSSMLSVGMNANKLSIDDVGSSRYNGNRQANDYIAGGGACVGINVARQSDAAFACEPSDRTATSGSRNGGALIWADIEGTLNFTALPSSGGASGINATTTNYWYANEVKAYRVMQIKPTNQVQIGQALPTTHTDYRLAVDGKLVAKSIFVAQTPSWADFVFEPTYALRPLPELEAYLKQNRHLPAIPSAAEVEKNGIDVAVMNAKLLQSLEELTLHVIELGKQNARLQAEVTALAAKVNQATTPAVSK